MHGPAVASLLVGKTCGVAPGVELINIKLHHQEEILIPQSGCLA